MVMQQPAAQSVSAVHSAPDGAASGGVTTTEMTALAGLAEMTALVEPAVVPAPPLAERETPRADGFVVVPVQPVRPIRRWLWAGLEIAVSIIAALVLPLWSRNINVDPLDRVGQVSGLAAVQLRFAIAAGVVIAALLLAHRLLGPERRRLATRLGCAAIAGLSTGLIAGGIVVALRGTPFSLWAGNGDYKFLFAWIEMLRRGEDIPNHYPPMILFIIHGWARISGLPLAFALKGVQIVGTALFGPAAYLCWRLVLRPGWALGIGVVAMLPFVEPVKPYPQITLVMLVPVLIAFYQRIRRAAELTRVRAVAIGALFGVGLGLLFLLYSGWFVWIAPSAVLVALLLTPWRTGLRPALLLVGTTTAVFIAISWVHLSGLFGGTGGVSDNYFYFDNDTEPTYFAMWRNDRPADVGSVWPPTGELGGVGLFTILLTVGLGVAIWFGWRRTAVIGLVSAAAGAWMIRMWLASEMYETQLVRLYPRTTMVILYCMLLLTGFGVMYAVEAARRWFAARSPAGPVASAAVPAGLLLLPLVFFFASAGSATANRYLPNEDLEHSGFLSWYAHKPRLPDGTCSYYGQRHGICRPR